MPEVALSQKRLLDARDGGAQSLLCPHATLWRVASFNAGSTPAAVEESAPHVEVRLVKDSPRSRVPQRTADAGQADPRPL